MLRQEMVENYNKSIYLFKDPSPNRAKYVLKINNFPRIEMNRPLVTHFHFLFIVPNSVPFLCISIIFLYVCT
jgi:hypothetical protein